MPAPQEIPGFYFDEEKNRYFPIKGPIPGRRPKRPPRPPAVVEATASSSPSLPSSFCSSSGASSSGIRITSQKGHLVNVVRRRKRVRTTDLLQTRELHGRLIRFNESRCTFEQEYEKVQASCPLVWEYPNTDLISDSALQQFYVLIQTPGGQMETNVLSMGSKAGFISIYEVGKVGRYFDFGFNLMPQPLWPPSIRENTMFNSVPGSIWSSHVSLKCPWPKDFKNCFF